MRRVALLLALSTQAAADGREATCLRSFSALLSIGAIRREALSVVDASKLEPGGELEKRYLEACLAGADSPRLSAITDEVSAYQCAPAATAFKGALADLLTPNNERTSARAALQAKSTRS